jgi:hypothetical protein
MKISSLEKRSAPGDHNQIVRRESLLLVTFSWLQKIKITRWSKSDGWRRDTQLSSDYQMVKEKKANLVMMIS